MIATLAERSMSDFRASVPLSVCLGGNRHDKQTKMKKRRKKKGKEGEGRGEGVAGKAGIYSLSCELSSFQ